MIRRKYYKKLFIIFLMLTLVYGDLLSSYYIYLAQTGYERQQLDFYFRAAEQSVKNMDQSIWSLDKYSDTIFFDDDFSAYLQSDLDYYRIAKVYDKLQTDMAVFSEIGARIGVTKVFDNMVITNQHTRNNSMYYQEMGFSDGEVVAIANFYGEEGNTKDPLIFFDTKENQLHLIKKRKYSNQDYLLLFLSVSTGNSNRLINQEIHVVLEDRLDEFGLIAKEIKKEQLTHKIQDGQVYMVRASGQYPKLQYLIMSPYDQSPLNKDGLLVAGVLFVSISLIGFLIASLLARTTYRPIGQVLSSFDDGDHQIDEFAFLETITKEIIQANETLKQTVENQMVDLKTKMLRELLLGIDNQIQISVLKENQLGYLLGPCRVVMIELQVQKGYEDVYLTQAFAKIRTSVATILEKALTLEGPFFDLVELSDHTYGLVLGEWQDGDVIKLLGRLLVAIEAREEVDMVMAIGRQVNDYGLLHQSAREGQELLRERSSMDRRAIITEADQEDKGSLSRYYYPLELEREIYQATISGQLGKLPILMEQLVRNNLDRHLSEREEVDLMKALLQTFKRIGQKLNLEDYYDDIENHIAEARDKSIGDKLFYFETKLNEMAETAITSSADKENELSHLMVAYIENHFHEDISLEEAAAHLNISAGYFCTSFKTLTGTNFKSYLNSYRVDQAKKWLKDNPNLKIKDLTLKLGYNNVNSFIRMFKKYEGISPGEYAKKFGNI